MESHAHHPHLQYSSPRALAMVLALVSALVLSPLYLDHRKGEGQLEARWSTGGLVLPVVVAGLIVAIRTTTTSSSKNRRVANFQYPDYVNDNDAGSELRIVSAPWGLAGILILLLFVISWQASVQHFLWR